MGTKLYRAPDFQKADWMGSDSESFHGGVWAGGGNVSQITGSDPRLRTVCRYPGPFNKLPQMLNPVSALSMLPW